MKKPIKKHKKKKNPPKSRAQRDADKIAKLKAYWEKNDCAKK